MTPVVVAQTELFFLPRVREEIEDSVEHRCSVVAMCNIPAATTRPRLLPSSKYYDTDLGGECVWIHPPKDQLRDALVHYIRCKDKKPLTTSAFVVTPASDGTQEAWTSALKGMVLLRQFSKSDKVYGKDGTESEVRSHKAVDVWWDPPCPPAPGRPVLAAVRLGVLSALPYIFTVAARRKTGFLYNAIVGRSREDILVDTGAFQNFMCRAAAARSGAVINLDTKLGTVRCAGQQEMAIIGWTEISIKLGSYMAVVQFLVVEKLIAEAGVILGLPVVALSHRTNSPAYIAGCYRARLMVTNRSHHVQNTDR